MSNKDPRTKCPPKSNRSILIDRRDVELTFLKKANEDYPLLASPCRSEQGEKRGRTASDNDNDIHFVGTGTPKRSRSSHRKSRTIVNSSLPATTINNNSNITKTRVDYVDNQSKNTHYNTYDNTEETYKFNITGSAISFAVNQSLPLIKFECEPKVKDQREGANIIKELFKIIGNDFKQVNPKHNDNIGFESWFMDTKGNICGITRDIYLFVYLCDVKNIPNMLLNTKITPILPKHLPPQCSVVIKGVPNVLSMDDFKMVIIDKYKSVYSIEDLMGTNNGRSRHLRMDLLNLNDYKQILNAGIICIEGQCLHVFEYLAAPRVMFCSVCNLPGHGKKRCQHPFERCKRCGTDRKLGEHSECEIICHNCKGNHISTDFRCPAIKSYRREIIKQIQLHPEILPDDVQIFIPSYCRQIGEKVLGNKRHYSQQRDYFKSNPKNYDVNHEWPTLPPPIRNTTTNSIIQNPHVNDQINDIQMQMNKLEKDCEVAKMEYDRKNMEIKAQFNSSIVQVQSLIICFSSIIQRQNEMIIALKSAVNECLKTNKITNQAICSLMNKSDIYQQHSEAINQLTSIPTEDRQESIEKLFSTYSPLIEDITKKIMEATNHLLATNER